MTSWLPIGSEFRIGPIQSEPVLSGTRKYWALFAWANRFLAELPLLVLF